jgi:hypothetical protein
MYQETEDGLAVIRLADNTTIPADEENSDWRDYLAWREEGNSPVPTPVLSLDALKNGALAGINRDYEAEFAAIKAQYPDAERESWPIQLSEAAALAEDPQAPTPFLDALLLARGFGETKAELAAKVQAKNQAYSVLSASLTGKRHALERQVLAATTVGQVEAIVWG